MTINSATTIKLKGLSMSTPNPAFTFHELERLKNPILIQQLFDKGQSKVIFPFRIIWMTTVLHSPFPAQIAVSVPKRAFRKAVQRNRIKRQIRVAYRLNKHLLYQKIATPTAKHNQQYYVPEQQIAFMLVFIARKKVDYAVMEQKMKKCLQYLAAQTLAR